MDKKKRERGGEIIRKVERERERQKIERGEREGDVHDRRGQRWTTD